MTVAPETSERNDSEYNIVMIKVIKEIYKYN